MSHRVQGFESPSTWRQPEPVPLSAVRTRLIGSVASQVANLGPRRLRVCVDGVTGAGKTSFGHELATALRGLGRPTLRASLDDFKRPWAESVQLGYDRTTGEGYYRNAWDFRSARHLLLVPAGSEGAGEVVLCARDPLTGVDHTEEAVTAPPDAVLIVDGVFAMRPELNDLWEFRIWLEVDRGTGLHRGIARDEAMLGLEEATRVHRDRYRASEDIYVSEVDPTSLAEVVVDNSDLSEPKITTPPAPERTASRERTP